MASGAPRQSDAIARRGLMLVLSSPSGAGKTTLSRMLLEADRTVALSVSVTTRKQRPGEIDGRDYHFIDAARFDAMVKKGELLEWAQVFGHRYGTPRAPVEAALAQGRDVLFDIDWQGTQQLREKADRDLVSIFVLPPSIPDLERRLRTRAQDSDEVIHAPHGQGRGRDEPLGGVRLRGDQQRFDRAFAEVRSILAAERLKRERQTGLSAFVRKLQAEL